MRPPLPPVSPSRRPGKPDQLRLLYKTDFKAQGEDTKNIRLKWLAVCLNMDYVTGQVYWCTGVQMYWCTRRAQVY